MGTERKYILLSCVVKSKSNFTITKYRLLNPANWASANIDAVALGQILLDEQAKIPGIKAERIDANITRLVPVYGTIARYACILETKDKIVSSNRPIIIVRYRKGVGCFYTDCLGKTKNYSRYNKFISQVLSATVSNGRFVIGANGTIDLVPLDNLDSFPDLTSEDLKAINKLDKDFAEVPADSIRKYMVSVEGEQDFGIVKADEPIESEISPSNSEEGIHSNVVYRYNGKEFTIKDDNGRERTVVVYFDNAPQKVSCRTGFGSLPSDSELCKPDFLFIHELVGKYQLKVAQKFERSHRFLYDTRLFYYGVFSKLERRVSDDLRTMGVTLNKLLYNLDFVKGLTLPEMNFVVLHELSHLIFRHILREKGRNHHLWNVVCDFYINKLIWDEFGFDYAVLVNLPVDEALNKDPDFLSLPQITGGIEYSSLPNQFLLDADGKRIPIQGGGYLKAGSASAVTYIDQFGVLHPGRDFCQVRVKKAQAVGFGVNTIADVGVKSDTTTIGIKLPDGVLFNRKVDVKTDTPEGMYAEFMQNKKQWKFYLAGMNGKPLLIPDNRGVLTPSGLPEGWQDMPKIAEVVSIVDSLVQEGVTSNAIAALLAEYYVNEYEASGVSFDFGDDYINPIFERFKQKKESVKSKSNKGKNMTKGSLLDIRKSKIWGHLKDFEGEDALGRKPKGENDPAFGESDAEDSNTDVRKDRDKNFSKLARQIVDSLKKKYPGGIEEGKKPIVNQIGDGSNQILIEYVEYYYKDELFYHEYVNHIVSSYGGSNGQPLDKGRTLQSGNGMSGDNGGSEIDEDTVEDDESSSMSDDARKSLHESTLRGAKACEQRIVKSASYGGTIRDSIVLGYVNKLLVPRLNWKNVLKNRLQSIMTGEESYSKLNKKYLASGYIMPGPIESEKLASGLKFCIDTSGSMSDKDIQYAFEQIEDVFKVDYRIGAEIIFWDDKVQGVLPFTNLANLLQARHKVVGRGGTNPNCIFHYFMHHNDYVLRKKQKPVLIVIFTDGEIMPVNVHKYRDYARDTLWVINRNDPASFRPGFGRVAQLRTL